MNQGKKTINRNAFDEKLLHRYLLETYYGINSDRAAVDSVMPPGCKWSDLNLVVPEDAKAGGGWRPDLVLHFRNRGPVPIEVKWKMTALKANQRQQCRQQGGAYASLTPNLTEHDGIPHISIPIDGFEKWLRHNISRLADDMFSEKGFRSGTSRQHWLVVLRGDSPIRNWNAMLAALNASGPVSPFWAFKNDRKGVGNVMRIRRGDVVHMLFVKTPGHRMAVSNDIGVARKIPLLVRGALTLEVKTPYFIPQVGQKPYDVFQPDVSSYSQMKWPHYIDFTKESVCEINLESAATDYGPIGDLTDEFVAAFIFSCNTGGGMPASLSESTARKLADRLR